MSRYKARPGSISQGRNLEHGQKRFEHPQTRVMVSALKDADMTGILSSDGLKLPPV